MPRRPRSVVWYYFDKIPNELHKSRCKICGAVCNNPSNTSNLFKHLRAKHPSTYKEAENRRKAEMEMYYELKVKSVRPVPRTETRGRRPASLIQATNIAVVKAEETLPNNDSTPLIKKLYTPEKVKQVKMRALLKMISVDLQPPSIVNEDGFREFVHTLDSRFELPAKKIVTKNLLPELAEETKHKIKLDVVIASFFALTVELWNYQKSQSLMTLTAHFIKDSWEMSSIVLETLDCTEDMTETSIASNFKRVTDEWGISDRIIALIANTSGDVIPSATLINGWEELSCFGHSLNIVVESALMSIAELVRIQKKVVEVVTYFENSTKASDTLAAIQQQHGLPVHRLKQKNPRFWTSMYAMFERMVEQFEAVNTVLCFLEKDHLCLCDDDVDLIRNTIEVLIPFEAATKELCTEQYTCMSKVIPIATLLQQVTSSGIATDPRLQSSLKNALITHMQTRFSNLENNCKLAVATLLDPRFKHHAFTDLSALELAQQRLLNETAAVVQNSDTQGMQNDISFQGDTSHSSLWNIFDRKVSEAGAMKTSTSDAENECRRYFKEANIPRNASALNWWKLNEVQFPHLKILAQKYLAIPATAVASNRLFTKQGDLISLRRDQIKPGYINTMIFLNKNLQITLLIIILEQQDKRGEEAEKSNPDTNLGLLDPCFNVSACAQRLVEAVNKFISAGERQSKTLRYEDLIHEMAMACEMLTMASDNLFIQAQKYESKHASGNIKSVLAQTAKDVLQGVLKVLLVKDDYYVRQLLEKTDSVLGLIKSVERVKDKTELVSTFKAITFAVLALKMELNKRCQNLCSKSCRDEIIIWVSVLQSSIPSLSKASLTYLKYRTSVSAMASRNSVMQEIAEACKKIKQLLQYGPQDKDEDGITSFVESVDKVLDSLSEVNRGTLHPDTETEMVFLVDHSLSVAHYAKGIYRELLISSCHRILQCKFRLLELDSALKEKPAFIQMRSEYETVCETVLDEVCQLEKHVNMALLLLIIETFLCPFEKLTQLKEVINNTEGRIVDSRDITIAEFIEHTENLCHVALLVAASSLDISKVREIVAAVRCLEHLDPDIAPAVLVLNKEPKSQAARKHLDLLLGRWVQEVSTVMDSVDSLVDPKVFMEMSEDVLAHEADVFETLRGCPHSTIQKHFNRFVSLSERPAVLAKKLVDESSDPVYRNGLRYYIRVLFQRITEAKNVFLEIMQTKHPPVQQYDTLERRVRLVLQAVMMLRDGLDVKNHPHLLSAKRVMFRQRGMHHGKGNTHHKYNKVQVKSQHADQYVQKTRNKEVSRATETHAPSRQTNQITEISTPPKQANQITEISTPSKQVNQVTEKPTSSEHTISDQTLTELTIKPSETEAEVPIVLPEIFSEKRLEGGLAAEIYEVAERLLTACARGDHKDVDNMIHNLLFWTNHIVENAEKLINHCSQIPKVEELKELLQNLDHLTPEISQKAKFVLAGDKQVGHALNKDTIKWAKMTNSARMIIDVTVDRWLVLTAGLQKTVEKHDKEQLKILINSMTSAQNEVCDLLVKVQSLTGKYMENGVFKAKLLLDMHNVIENLMLTITTAVDVTELSADKAASDWWHLSMVCRDWSVSMASAVCELDNISDRMELVGKERFRALQARVTSRGSLMVNLVEEEVNCILEMVDCVAVGDSTMKARSDEMVVKLQSAQSDLMTVAKLPLKVSGSSLGDLVTRLKLRLATNVWIEKAAEVQDMVRNNCYEYLGFTHQILMTAQEVSLNDDLKDDVKIKDRQELCSQFLEKSQQLKQQVLKIMHADPDHTRRVVVRSTLDQMSKLTSQIEGFLRSSENLSNADVNSLSDQWAARMKKLMFNLRRMNGINSSAVLEIERMNKASFDLHRYQRPHHQKVPGTLYPQQHLLHKQQQHVPYLEQHQEIPLNYQLLGPHEQHHLYSPCGHHPAQKLQSQLSEKVYTASSAPVQSARNLLEFDAAGIQHSRNVSDDTITPTQKGNSVQNVLNDAKYLSNRLNKWQNADNVSQARKSSKVIQSALDMAHLCSEIALFTRGQGSLKDSEEVIDAASAIVSHSLCLEEFSRKLLSLTSNRKCVDSLEACLNKMNTCASQLHIISTVLHNSAKSFQGDHILMKNAVNLLMAVRQMFSVAEGVAAKGVEEPGQSDMVTIEVLDVLGKMQLENEYYIRQQRQAAQVNDLGLRRMDIHDPPTLTSLARLKMSR